MNEKDYTDKIDNERKYQGLNENGSMSQRKIERNKINAPGMLNYDALAKALQAGSTSQDKTLWGFVSEQQEKTKKKTD